MLHPHLVKVRYHERHSRRVSLRTLIVNAETSGDAARHGERFVTERSDKPIMRLSVTALGAGEGVVHEIVEEY